MEPAENDKNSLRINLKLVVLFLMAVITAMLFIWKPWTAGNNDRTVEVTGTTTLTARPDEFVFYPSYQFKNSDKEKALAALSKKSSDITARLKALGVEENKIKTSSTGNDYPIIYESKVTDDTTYLLQFTITVGNLELAQKVQDYLVTTTPTGTVSPQADFSDSKRKELEGQARDAASKDARSKADQMAKNLGFKIAAVKSVTDGGGFNILPYDGREVAVDSSASKPSLDVQPGENELDYTVTVVYFIR